MRIPVTTTDHPTDLKQDQTGDTPSIGAAVDAAAVRAAAADLAARDAVLRMSEQDAAELGTRVDPDDDLPDLADDETMIINMGPSHPSTHGVLRLMLELDGETVVRTKPVIGYLHTGMEWTGEELSYLQGPTNVTRMDYASPLFTELAFSLATDQTALKHTVH